MDENAEQAVTERDSSKSVIAKKSFLAKVSLMMSHIERCYAEDVTNRLMEVVLALEIYRTLIFNYQALTEVIIKAITMTYQDIFRVRSGGQGRVIYCMFRIPLFRFRRSLNLA